MADNDNENGGSGEQVRVLPTPKRKIVFEKDLRPMMYGFGDAKHPLTESVAAVEDIVLEYITTMTERTVHLAALRGRMKTEDLIFLIRADRKKHQRVRELLTMNEILKKTRKAFDAEEEPAAKRQKTGHEPVAATTKKKRGPKVKKTGKTTRGKTGTKSGTKGKKGKKPTSKKKTKVGKS